MKKDYRLKRIKKIAGLLAILAIGGRFLNAMESAPKKKELSKEKKAAYVADLINVFHGRAQDKKGISPETIFKEALPRQHEKPNQTQTLAYAKLRLTKIFAGLNPYSMPARKDLIGFKSKILSTQENKDDVSTAIKFVDEWKNKGFKPEEILTPEKSEEELLKEAVILSLVSNHILNPMIEFFDKLSSFKERDKKGLDAFVLKLQKAIEAEKAFDPAFAFYHARPASYALLFDVTTEMRKIALAMPEATAWRSENPQKDEDFKKDAKEWIKERLKERQKIDSVMASYSQDCFSFSSVGFAHDDSAMLLFVTGEAVSQKDPQGTAQKISQILGTQNQDKDTFKLVQQAIQLSQEKIGNRLYQIFINPESVDSIAWLADVNGGPSELQKKEGESKREVKVSEFLRDLKQYETAGFFAMYIRGDTENEEQNEDEFFNQFIDVVEGIEKNFQVRFRFHHPDLYNPKKTLIREYYSLDPSADERKEYKNLVHKIAVALLERHLQGDNEKSLLDGSIQSPSVLRKVLDYLDKCEAESKKQENGAGQNKKEEEK